MVRTDGKYHANRHVSRFSRGAKSRLFAERRPVRSASATRWPRANFVARTHLGRCYVAQVRPEQNPSNSLGAVSMIRKMLPCQSFVSLVLVLATTALAGDGPAADSLRGEKYQLALAKTYNMQAHDHARMLDKYAALGERVPADVVQEHAAAIRFNAKAARKSFARLGETAKNPAIAGQLAQMQQRLNKVTELADRLEAQAAQEGSGEAQLIGSQSAEISRQLRANHVDARETDSNFYGSDSESYYFTGEGHFVD
jgi:hypothetical protein